MTAGMTFTETQRKIIEGMINNPKISLKRMSEDLEINISALQKQIESLKEQELIERVGANFGGYWKVISTALLQNEER